MSLPKLRQILLFSCWGVCALIGRPAMAVQMEGTVESVVDGRTFVFRDKKKKVHGIILMGIDPPANGQALFNKATRELSSQILKKTVLVDWYRLEKRCSRAPKPDCSKVAKVLRLPDGLDPALHMLRGGYAWHKKDSLADQSTTDRRLYDEAEQIAQFKKVGVWSSAKPQTPWEFRNQKKKAVKELAVKPKSSAKSLTKKKEGVSPSKSSKKKK